MITQPLVHIFICHCGRQGRALTYELHDCKCGISRRYSSPRGTFYESLYRTLGYPSEVIRYERVADLFVYVPDRISPPPDAAFPEVIQIAKLQEAAWFAARAI